MNALSHLGNLDQPTLQWANAVFNGLACLIWALVCGLLPGERRAGLSLAAAHLTRIGVIFWASGTSQSMGQAASIRGEACSLLTVALVLIGLRAVVRSARGVGDVIGVTVACALAGLCAYSAGRSDLMLVASSMSMGVVSLLAYREVTLERRELMPPWVARAIALPFLFGVMGAVYRGARPWIHGYNGSAALNLVIWLVLSLTNVLSLLGLVVARLIAGIKALTQIDPLTSAMNRRATEAKLRELCALARLSQAFCVVVLDIDHFKSINDRHGHACGDAVLKQVADELRQGCRPYDHVGRLGGEEFCVLMPDARLAQGLAAAERLRLRLQSRPFEWLGESIAVTASFGVAEDALGAQDGAATLARADVALYRAKSEGRNRVCAAAELACGLEQAAVGATP